jgi:uncharacterized protein (TIGR04255 family)
MLSWLPAWVPRHIAENARHYRSAPIVEAILEWRVEGESIQLERLRTLSTALDGWSDASVSGLRQGLLEMAPEGDAAGPGDLVGYAFSRGDGRRNIHASVDRFAFAWLGQYEDWDSLVAEALVAWEAFREIAQPSSVTRIGARFVNVIKVPGGEIEISDYLRTSVNISPYLPQVLTGYFTSVDIPLDPDRGIGATITSALTPVDGGYTGLALDLDTYCAASLDLAGPDSMEDMNHRLSTLRVAKNYVFEASITDATRGLIR